MKKEKAKKIINRIFGGLLFLLILGTFVLLVWPFDEEIDKISRFYAIMIIQIFSIFMLCYYGILWRSVYHLFTDEPRKICYSVIDVLSIIALVFGGGALTADVFSVHNWDIPYLGIAIAVLAVRTVCFVAYKIAEL